MPLRDPWLSGRRSYRSPSIAAAPAQKSDASRAATLKGDGPQRCRVIILYGREEIAAKARVRARSVFIQSGVGLRELPDCTVARLPSHESNSRHTCPPLRMIRVRRRRIPSQISFVESYRRRKAVPCRDKSTSRLLSDCWRLHRYRSTALAAVSLQPLLPGPVFVVSAEAAYDSDCAVLGIWRRCSEDV